MPDIKIPFQAVNMDLDAQDAFIKSVGIQMEHFKAIVCPIGAVDLMDGRAPHHEHHGCSNGYIYRFAGTVYVQFTSNTATSSLTDIGLIDGSVVNVTFKRFYEDNPNKQVYVQIYDRFYVKNKVVLAPNSQKVEAHITGIDKFTYKVEEVEDPIIDANNVQYFSGDYTIRDGVLYWGDKRPVFNPATNKGTIYSIRYLYTPFFYVSRLIHEVRVQNKTDFISGEIKQQRAPYSAFLSREYYLYKEEKDTLDDTRRDLISPRDGSFGPR
jgi:hypothetical protein